MGNVKHALQFLTGHFKKPGSRNDLSKKRLQSTNINFKEEKIKAVGKKNLLAKFRDTYCTNTTKTSVNKLYSRCLGV